MLDCVETRRNVDDVVNKHIQYNIIFIDCTRSNIGFASVESGFHRVTISNTILSNIYTIYIVWFLFMSPDKVRLFLMHRAISFKCLYIERMIVPLYFFSFQRPQICGYAIWKKKLRTLEMFSWCVKFRSNQRTLKKYTKCFKFRTNSTQFEQNESA